MRRLIGKTPTHRKSRHMTKYFKRPQNGEAGFTLVELLVVIVIMGVLAGVVVFAVGGVTGTSQQGACKADTSSINTAEEVYNATNTTNGYGSMANLTSAGLLKSASTLHTVTTAVGTPSASYTLAPIGTTCTGGN